CTFLRERLSSVKPSTWTAVCIGSATGRGVDDRPVGGGLDAPVPLPVCVGFDGEGRDVALAGVGAAVGRPGGFADLDREVDRGVLLEHGHQVADHLSRDVTRGREGAGTLPTEGVGGTSTEDVL